MHISDLEVAYVFERLLSGELTRNDADRWAHSILKASEQSKIQFTPEKRREKIWDAVMYLYGIDLRSTDDDYMFSDQDIRGKLRELLQPDEQAQ